MANSVTVVLRPYQVRVAFPGPQGVPGDSGSGGGGNGWYPVSAIVSDGARRVAQIVDWVGGTGDKPPIGMYIGAAGYEALIANGVDLRGAQGPQGETGVAGPQGPQGLQGIQGPTGADGMQGPQGIQGPAGADGAPGADGAQGIQGIQGVQGIQGPAGADGATGPAGADGAQGIQGIQGPAGVDGADGADGLNGWSPVLANVTDGARRVQQVVDWTGGTGTKPATGLYVGALGLTATIGDATDIRGATGPAGADGADGAPGADGADGAPGADGADGLSAAPVVTVDTTTYTLGLTDVGKYLRFTHASGCAITLPEQAAVAWAGEVEIGLRAVSAGPLTFILGSVTLNPSSITTAQNTTLAIKRVAENIWDLI